MVTMPASSQQFYIHLTLGPRYAKVYTEALKTGNWNDVHELPLPLTPFPFEASSPVSFNYDSYDWEVVMGRVFALSQGVLLPNSKGGTKPTPIPFSHFGVAGVYFGGLGGEIRGGEIREICEMYGGVEWIRMERDYSCCGVRMRNSWDAERLLASLQGFKIKGRVLCLDYLDVTVEEPRRLDAAAAPFTPQAGSRTGSPASSFTLGENELSRVNSPISSFWECAHLDPIAQDVSVTRNCTFGPIKPPTSSKWYFLSRIG